MLNEHDQDLGGLGRERDGLTVAREHTVAQIQVIWSKLVTQIITMRHKVPCDELDESELFLCLLFSFLSYNCQYTSSAFLAGGVNLENALRTL